LKLLEEMEIPASFFIPAVAGQLHPQSVDEILKGGHEVGVHGWIHELASDLTPDQERELLGRSFDYWAERLGHPPAGIRTPSWDLTPFTLGILRDLGFMYDSSLMGDDRPYELMVAGEATGMVELPVEWLLDDYPYLQIMRESGFLPYIKPDDVLEIWKREFEVARDEGTMLLLTMHPQVIGHRSRWGMLKDLVSFLKEQQGVWFARHDEIARHVAPEESKS
jgi:peptidoglycan/xylan/chitin deacetylase (PgdA/CDA1 family)